MSALTVPLTIAFVRIVAEGGAITPLRQALPEDHLRLLIFARGQVPADRLAERLTCVFHIQAQ
jgi:hypothetical protein